MLKIAPSVTLTFWFQGVFAYYIISYSAVTYDDYEYPGWAEGMGLCISFSSMVWVPAYFIYYLVTGPGTIRYLFYHLSSDENIL